MDSLLAFLPIDRQLALANYIPLHAETRVAALFADLSGFTPLTEALVHALGPQRGAEELTRQLNLVYDALIGFSGDAITCWFDEDDGLRAIASALAMQMDMQQFSTVTIPNGGTVALALKAAIVAGKVNGVRRAAHPGHAQPFHSLLHFESRQRGKTDFAKYPPALGY